MRKAWKIAALLIGLPAILTGWLALDSYSRAVSAIAAHDSRLRSEIAALRSQQVPSLLLQGRDTSLKSLEKLPCPASMFQDPSASALERGHTVHQKLYWKTWHDHSAFEDEFRQSRHRQSADELITALAVTHAAVREGGFHAQLVRFVFDYEALVRFPRALTRGTPDAPQLRKIATELDQLFACRPSLASFLAGEHLLDQVQTLSILHARSDPIGWLRRPPGWKEFFSWRILIAKALNQLEDEYQDLIKLPPDSYPQRKDSYTPSESALTLSELEREAFQKVKGEKRLFCFWQLARVSVALARFRADKSKDPADLKELVPEYLSEVPINPLDEKPILYQNGHLKAASFPNNPEFDWNLKPE